jgi:HAD superfamily hydrolase (TIGR01458 family)
MRARAVMLDLDGTLYVDDHAIPGAPEAIARIRAAGLPLRFITNTTRFPRRALHERLVGLGFDVAIDDLFTAPLAAAALLRARGLQRVMSLLPRTTEQDLVGLTLTDDRPEAVVVGDLGAAWTFDRLNRAFRAVLDGATLVATQKSRYWKSGSGLMLDAGPFVVALEYAAGREAVVAGKPAAAFYAAAVDALGLAPGDVVMVGDDAASDASGARRAGCQGILVRTGKYRPGDETGVEPPPTAVIDSVAALPAWLGVT